MSKKRAIFTIVACSIAVLILSGVLLVGLKNDGFGFLLAPAHEKGGQPFGFDYDVEIDPATDPVDALEIDWEAGPVQVVVGKSAQIRITETSSRGLTDEEHMKVLVNGTRLEIDWDHNRFRFLPFPLFGTEDKSLVVELPAGVARALARVECSNVSGDMEVEGITCGEGSFSSVSGALQLTGVTCTGPCEMSTTSGDVIGDGLGADTLSVSTTSGALNFEGASAEEASLSTVSGELHFQGSAGRFGHSSISGSSHAELSACPKELDMNSVSGQITLVLPPDASFRAGHSSVSGDFSCDFPGSGDTYGTGKPQGDLEFSTTSGGIMVMKG